MLDLQLISSPQPTKLDLQFKQYTLNIESEDVDKIINIIRNNFQAHFANMPENLRFKVEVAPATRLQQEEKSGLDEDISCDGYVSTYLSYCNYLRISPNVEVSWHFSNLPDRVRLFDLRRFTKKYSEHSISVGKELEAALMALKFNRYFESLVVKKYRLDKDSFLTLSEVMKYNETITELSLIGTDGASASFANLFDSMSVNSKSKVCVCPSLVRLFLLIVTR